MNIESRIRECQISLNQINYFDPDPYYVNYFFDLFIKSASQVLDGIFEEANDDFGLFMTNGCSKEKFLKKATAKNDQNALEFAEWFEKKIKSEHKPPYPNFIKEMIDFQKRFSKLPKVKVMIRPNERYSKDTFLEIKVNLSNERLRSKEDLNIEIKRNVPIFLEIINRKRSSNNEPKVTENKVRASAFMEDGSGENFEISYASELYIPVLKRIVKESRQKIKNASWKQF